MPKLAFAEDWEPEKTSNMVVRAPGMDVLKVSLAKPEKIADGVSVWEWFGSALDEGEEASCSCDFLFIRTNHWRTRRGFASNSPQKGHKGHSRVSALSQVLTTLLFSLPESCHCLALNLLMSWSPDGSFLLIPAGSFKLSPTSEAVNATYVFFRKDLSRPALQLPGANKPVVAVRFCPVPFKLRGSNSEVFFKLPYRIVFAIATLNSVYIYDTECVAPIAVLAGIHYAAITDITW